MKAADVDKLAAETVATLGSRSGKGCRVGRELGALSDVGAAARKYVLDKTYPVRAATTLLAKLGIKVSEKSVRTHRNNECSCESVGLR